MSIATSTAFLETPIGWLCVTGTSEAVTSLTFCETPSEPGGALQLPVQQCLTQLSEYFDGRRKSFQLPLLPAGTDFQRQVWQSLQEIPFGATCSYLEIARRTSGEKAIRAVGAANGRNPLCIVVPCHRVIGSDGSLTGYAGGLWRKEWLLRHEGMLHPSQQLQLF